MRHNENISRLQSIINCMFASLYLQIQFDEFRRDWRFGVKKYKNSIIQ